MSFSFFLSTSAVTIISISIFSRSMTTAIDDFAIMTVRGSMVVDSIAAWKQRTYFCRFGPTIFNARAAARHSSTVLCYISRVNQLKCFIDVGLDNGQIEIKKVTALTREMKIGRFIVLILPLFFFFFLLFFSSAITNLAVYPVSGRGELSCRIFLMTSSKSSICQQRAID